MARTQTKKVAARPDGDSPAVAALIRKIAARPLDYEGSLLTEARRVAGLTQGQLAAITGDAPSDISNMERDRVRVQRRIWYALARHGVDPDALTPPDDGVTTRVTLSKRAHRVFVRWGGERNKRVSELLEAQP